MITDINSEDRLVQQTFSEHLERALGWESVYAYNAGQPGLTVVSARASCTNAWVATECHDAGRGQGFRP